MERPRRATLKQNTKIFNIGAQEWLPDRLKAQTEDMLHLLFHAVAWQYFPKALQRECDAAQKKTGAKAVTSKQFAHLAMEADGKTPVAAIRLRLWPEKLAIDLGRVDFHERWVKCSSYRWKIV